MPGVRAGAVLQLPTPEGSGVRRRGAATSRGALGLRVLPEGGSEDLIKLLVAKTLPSRALRARVVPNKGVADPEVVERVHRGITEMGVMSPCAFKCDNEPAIRALRKELMRRAGDGAVPQDPPVGESESNGVVEAGVKLLKGMVRVYVLDLERKLGVHIPVGHAAVA